MNFQALVDSMAAMTCVVSVEVLEDGSCGPIRIVTGNESYIGTIERPAAGQDMLTQKFVPNSEYTRYLTRDLNFEDYCFRSAVHKKCLHSYAHPERINVWFNMTFLPLDADDGNLRYCTYTMEIDHTPNAERLSSVTDRLAGQVLANAIRLRSAGDFKAAMGDVIKDIREACKAQYACILLMDDGSRTCSMLCEDIEEGSNLKSLESIIDDGFYEIAESWEGTIAGSNCLVVKNAQDMEVVKQRNPRWFESLTASSVESIVLFPLKLHGDLLGYMWAMNFAPDDSTMIKEALELATLGLASEISNYQLFGQLKVLSSKDMLTGVQNRNEMNNRIAALESDCSSPIGVAYADLNGLKTVNDREGHSAGDQMLKNGAKALLKAFSADEVFRAGGDEFAIITPGVSEDELARRAETVRQAAHDAGGVEFAIGYCIADDGPSIRTALIEADARMYEDKRAYYNAHPEKDRRSR